jgi:hypothetical protein
MNDEAIKKQLKQLILQGKQLSQKLQPYSVGGEFFEPMIISHNIEFSEEVISWVHSASNLLVLRFGKDSDYYKAFQNALDVPWIKSNCFFQENISMGNGVLISILDALQKGLTYDIFFKHEVIVFGDLLTDAFSLLSGGHRHASAIYGRIVLETTVKEYAKKFGVEERNFEDTINTLRRQEIIHQSFQERMRSIHTIGNKAAHGTPEFDRITNEEIHEGLMFIKERILTLE